MGWRRIDVPSTAAGVGASGLSLFSSSIVLPIKNLAGCQPALQRRVDLARNLRLDVLPGVAEVLHPQLLEKLFLQGCRLDAQVEQLPGVVELIAEVADVKLIQT